MSAQIVLSGIRATGRLHIGNYLGAIRFFAELAEKPDYRCFFFIANLHTLTTREESEAIEADMREIVRWYLAAGIDPARHVIYAQSSVPEITELTWLLMCLVGMGELDRLPHFKEKRDEMAAGGNPPNAGIYTYPVLMAADILAPSAHLVPVGEDQHPHVELARTLARRFNKMVGEELFPVPDLMDGPGVRVPGLKGTGKMGKSHPESTISLDETPDVIMKRCRRADKKLPPTPSLPDPVEPRVGASPGEPEICRVFQLHTLLPGDVTRELQLRNACKSGDIECGACKTDLGDRIVNLLAPLQERYRAIKAQGDDYIEAILHDGGRRAREHIAPTVARAKHLMGVRGV
ncbi:tryptophan--tRNA ligase [Candidatus Uhrbacteria bacterium]|nr:tryptophan--tRNA ligase [Candidatus Uhrbacteria bacterium]